MYYPIIDKLKTLMTDITSVKDKEPLVINGTMTSQVGGTWTGNYSDVQDSFQTNRIVLFKITVGTDTACIPILSYSENYSISAFFPFNQSGTIVSAYGIITPNNRFQLNILNA